MGNIIHWLCQVMRCLVIPAVNTKVCIVPKCEALQIATYLWNQVYSKERWFLNTAPWWENGWRGIYFYYDINRGVEALWTVRLHFASNVENLNVEDTSRCCLSWVACQSSSSRRSPRIADSSFRDNSNAVESIKIRELIDSSLLVLQINEMTSKRKQKNNMLIQSRMKLLIVCRDNDSFITFMWEFSTSRFL